jgi:WD repeat-containing protein 90
VNALFASNNLIVQMNMETSEQHFMIGHTAPVVALAVSRDGALFASAQEGRNPMIRLWDLPRRRCVAYLMGGGLDRDVRALTISTDRKLLAALGKDSSGRATIVVWTIADALETGKTALAARQVSEHSINRLAFSPFEDDAHTLVSCGYESVRFWRIKNKHLPACKCIGKVAVLGPSLGHSL